MSHVDIDKLRKKYGDRRAFEWFMRAEDQRYWNMTEKLVKEEKERTMETLKKGGIAIVALMLILHLIFGFYIHYHRDSFFDTRPY